MYFGIRSLSMNQFCRNDYRWIYGLVSKIYIIMYKPGPVGNRLPNSDEAGSRRVCL